MFLLCVIWLFGSVESLEKTLNYTVAKRADVCYDKLGCFSNGPPFFSLQRPLSFLPQSPEDINTKLLLYTRESNIKPQELAAVRYETVKDIWTLFKVRPTKFLIHGFLDMPLLLTHWQEMKDELLIQGDYNVIIVDWSGGNLPPYTQATANTRVVGAQVGVLINKLIETFGMSSADFHVIGHSLGAHTAGYVGERVQDLGRITGADPAGPYFEDTDVRVRLDQGDAVFVDVIHSDAKSLIQLGQGTRTQSGDVDFYPNSGHDQPGCGETTINNFQQYEFLDAAVETINCNHMRCVRLFTESINSKCPFLAVSCNSENDFNNNLCNFCGSRGCSRMGYHADKYKPSNGEPTKYYFSTGDRLPFCRYHVIVTIIFASGKGEEEEGTIDLLIGGDVILGSKVSLTGDTPQTFKPGQTYTFNVILPQDVGNITFVTLSWKKAASILNVFPFNIFSGSSKPTLYLSSIGVYRQEAHVDANFCADDQSVQEGTSLKFTKRC